LTGDEDLGLDFALVFSFVAFTGDVGDVYSSIVGIVVSVVPLGVNEGDSSAVHKGSGLAVLDSDIHNLE